ncbi:UNVERIFIED_CONTAM: hypothetical protein Sradi_5549400 [Sesamum radiatum]|uniref:Uncharacterized protein n=1 Tax=Sesamum radiatum TaxID=300843 RepID=A0AAW2LBJ6_SESRA
MASYDNLTTIEQPWSFRPAFAADAWISDVFTKENDAITKALQNSFTSTTTTSDVFSPGMVDSLFAKPDVTPTPSGGSENDAPVSKLQRRSVPQRKGHKAQVAQVEASCDDDVYRRGSGEFQADGAAGDWREVRRLERSAPRRAGVVDARSIKSGAAWWRITNAGHIGFFTGRLSFVSGVSAICGGG